MNKQKRKVNAAMRQSGRAFIRDCYSYGGPGIGDRDQAKETDYRNSGLAKRDQKILA
jgi:hypothetical protein